MSQRTPLFEAHVAAGAKIVDFAGWEMPINYGSQIEEHHAVRRAAGMFDVSHMLAIDLHGNDVQAYLRRLIANDVAKLTTPGRALYSCMLNEEGGVVDDLIVYFFEPTRYRVVVNAGTAEKDMEWMQAQIGNLDVNLTPRRDLAMIAVQGPQARELFWTAFPVTKSASEKLGVFRAVSWSDWLIARTGYTGEDGLEISLPSDQAMTVWQQLLDAGVKPAGLGARDTLRLEAGMNLYGQDMDETTSPLESGLAWTVDLKTERDFVGRAALESSEVTKQLVGLLLLDKGVLRSHQKVITKNGDGEITSGTFSPTMQQSIALARIPLGIAPGEEVEVEIRDKKLKARVVKYPFVRNGKVLIET